VSAADPCDAVQLGLYTLLTGDPGLSSLINGVFDSVREDVELDYLVIGEVTSTPDGVHGVEGRQVVAVMHTWTRAESHAPGNAIASRVVGLLWHRHAELDAVVAGHRVWRVDHEFSQSVTDPEPHVRHRVDRFRIFTSQGG
jgi:hypothetical protein